MTHLKVRLQIIDVRVLGERFISLIKTFIREGVLALYRFHLVLKCDGKRRRKDGGGTSCLVQ